MEKWYAEHFGDFSVFGGRLKFLCDQGNHRRHGKGRDGFVRRKSAQNLDILKRQTDFLVRLAQCGGDQVSIPLVLFAPRKCDLSGVMFQGRGPLGQDQVIAIRSGDDRRKHGRRTQFAPGGQRHIRIEIEI